jgi:hypothetical protein
MSDIGPEEQPEQIIVCAREGDWIIWTKDRAPESGDCMFGGCDCVPVLYRRDRGAVERAEKAEADLRMLRAYVDRGEYEEDVRERFGIGRPGRQ